MLDSQRAKECNGDFDEIAYNFEIFLLYNSVSITVGGCWKLRFPELNPGLRNQNPNAGSGLLGSYKSVKHFGRPVPSATGFV